jgi:hypothetical protein
VKSVRRSPNGGYGLRSLAAAILVPALIAALSLWLAAPALAQISGEDDSFEGDGGGPGAPGQDGADSVGGESGQSGTHSRGADGVSRTGRSVRGTVIEEGTTEEQPPAPAVVQPSTVGAKKSVRKVAPVQQQQPTADFVPGQPPAPASSGPPETLIAPQPQLKAEGDSSSSLLAWLLLIAGGLLAVALIWGARRGTRGSGRRSLRDAPA